MDRFWDHVDATGDCWLWTGYTNPKGYGRTRIDGRALQAHRVAYERLVGPIPDGLTLDHLCRVRACVNPDHLEPVTNRENILRGDTLPAANARKTHCIHGHEFTPANAYIRSARGGKHRACWTCIHEQRRAYKLAAIESAGPGQRACVLATGHRGLHRGNDGNEWSWYVLTGHRRLAATESATDDADAYETRTRPIDTVIPETMAGHPAESATDGSER